MKKIIITFNNNKPSEEMIVSDDYNVNDTLELLKQQNENEFIKIENKSYIKKNIDNIYLRGLTIYELDQEFEKNPNSLNDVEKTRLSNFYTNKISYIKNNKYNSIHII